jgi:type I restriction enzyme S subunit
MPPQNERIAIANFLNEQTARIDALIAEKETLAASLKDIEEVTAYDLVTRGLRPDVSRVAHREEWLPEAPSHWGLQKLRQLATVGNGSTPKRDNEDYWDGGQIPWLNSGAVNASRITEASDFVTAVARKECHLPMVRAGSTVIALTGQGKTRGSASITEIETAINQHLAFVSLFDDRMSDEYLWVLLTGMYTVLRYLSDGEGSTKGALTCEQLNQLRVLVPPKGEQVELVAAYRERVNAIEVLREHTAVHIDRLREYRSSLISAAVTGQLNIGAYKETA